MRVVGQCTLRNFPSDIVHCIEWAREKFDDLFVSGADLANSFLEDRAAFFLKLKQDALTEADALRDVHSWLLLASAPSFDLCVRVLLDDFLANFRNAINDLTHNFPRDARNVEKDTGVDLGPFWHGHKRFPQSATFDPSNPLHVDYVYHGSNILAAVVGLPEQDRDAVVRIAQSLPIPPYVFTGATVDLSGDGKEGEEEKKSEEPPAAAHSLSDDDSAELNRLTTALQQLNAAAIKRLHTADFEKVRNAAEPPTPAKRYPALSTHRRQWRGPARCVRGSSVRPSLSLSLSLSVGVCVCPCGLSGQRPQPPRGLHHCVHQPARVELSHEGGEPQQGAPGGGQDHPRPSPRRRRPSRASSAWRCTST